MDLRRFIPRPVVAILLANLSLAGALPAAEVMDGPAVARLGTTGSIKESARRDSLPPGRLFRLQATSHELVILDWDQRRLREAVRRPGPITVRDFPLGEGAVVDLEITPFSVTGRATRFVLGRKGQTDETIDFDPSSLILLRGRVAGRPGSHVFMGLSENTSTGYVDLGVGGKRYRISSRDKKGLPLEPGQFSIFMAGATPTLPPDVPFCGVSALSPGATAVQVPAVDAVIGPLKGLKTLELAVETDYEFFSLFGDTDEALTYLTMMYGQVSDIYIRDVDTRVELTFVRLWDNPNDLFNDVDPSPLPEFQDYWNANMSSVTRDAAQLFSGRRDYPFGGQGYLSSLCGSNAYSVVGYAMGFFPDPTRPSPYTYDISVTAHELGHNSGTGHTHDSPNLVDTCNDPLTAPQRGTIMSYCSQTWSGGNANRDLYFHARIQQNMDFHIGSASCVIEDCNRNSIPDSVDISQSTSLDSNSNNIPDECEDCNGNSVLDDVDISQGTSLDLDGNSVPDECQPDCNSNLIPDAKDIADGISLDQYGNGIPDECEADCDSDNVSDYTQIQTDMTLDIDRSAVLDVCQDCDLDATPDLDALGGAHRVWVASGQASANIREFHPSTGVLARVSSGGAGALVNQGADLIVAPDHNVLVSSGGDHRVMEFDTAGTYLGDLVTPGRGGLSSPAGLVITPDGNTLLVASSGTDSVLAFDVASGASQGAFVATGSGGLTSPFGLIFGPSGNLFVTGGGNQILEYNGQSGSFVRVFVSADDNSGLDQARGMAFKPDGNLLVASFGTNEVLEFNGQTGAPMGRWAHAGTATRLTQISPWGVRIGPNGNVFVARTGESFGSGTGSAENGLNEQAYQRRQTGSRVQQLHLTEAQIYEFNVADGNFLRAYISGHDHGLLFPTGFAFVPGWDLDCNLNLLPDSCDVSQGFSADLDLNGTPDECETDCNANGTLDRLDIIPYGTALDCNYNLSPDSCDISTGSSADCTGNGIPDECEFDCNDNLVADSCDIGTGTSLDCNANGIPDECDISDDLETDMGWTVGAAGDTARKGVWTRVDPNGTAAQPEDDHTPGAGTLCFVTGQGKVGGPLRENNVDGGSTTLISPSFDLGSEPNAEIGYWRWFSNITGTNPNEDVLTIDISGDGGQSWTPVETVGPAGAQAAGGWFFHRFRVSDFVEPTSNVVLRFVATDAGGNSIVEAGIDDLVLFPGCCASPIDCDDDLSCTSDACSLSGGCLNILDASKCLIAGICYDHGDPNPFNGCEACDTSSGLNWSLSPPPEVAGVSVNQAGTTQLTWDAQGTGMAYDIIGGTISMLRPAGGIESAQCLADNILESNWSDSRSVPDPGEGHYYLVRSQGTCGDGTYGLATSGTERLPTEDCP